MSMDWAIAKWKAPTWVQAFTTSRNGGNSRGVYRSLNLSYDVGDFKEFVDANQDLLTNYVGRRVPFLQLQHGTRIIEVTEDYPSDLVADAAIIRQEDLSIGILTADCMPIFFSDLEGTVAAIAHVGWRGLAGGLIEKVVAQMKVNPKKITAYIGPAIHAYSYYVGKEVYDEFLKLDPQLKQFFRRSENPEQPQRAHCDLVRIATHRFNSVGVEGVLAHGSDTFRDSDNFYSFRRDGSTGRMASVIHLIRDTNAPIVEEKKGVSVSTLNETLVQKQVQKAKEESAKSVDIDLDF